MAEQEPPKLTPKYRDWLWVWSTLLATAPLMGLMFQLARVSEIPLIIAFAPAVLLGKYLGASSELAGAYYLMPLQCFVYGLLMAQSELSGKRWPTLAGLLIAHVLIAMRALSVTGGVLQG